MIRIFNPIYKHPKGNFQYYTSKLYDCNHIYDLNENKPIIVKSKEIRIENVLLPHNLTLNFKEYLRLNTLQCNSFYFARYIVNSKKHNVYSLPIHHLEYLKPFDKVGFIQRLYKNGEIRTNHEAIYIGKKLDKFMFISKISSYGIYITSLEQLLRLYQPYYYFIMVYSPIKCLSFDNLHFEGNIIKCYDHENPSTPSLD